MNETAAAASLRKKGENGEWKVTAIYLRKAIIVLLCLAGFARSFAIGMIALDEWDLLINTEQWDRIHYYHSLGH